MKTELLYNIFLLILPILCMIVLLKEIMGILLVDLYLYFGYEANESGENGGYNWIV